jgi:hypothetical protein
MEVGISCSLAPHTASDDLGITLITPQVLWNAQINKVNPSRHKDSIWRWVWKWKGPKRIKAFLWIAAQNGLLTNEARVRRHFTKNPSYCQQVSKSETNTN